MCTYSRANNGARKAKGLTKSVLSAARNACLVDFGERARFELAFAEFAHLLLLYGVLLLTNLCLHDYPPYSGDPALES